MRVLPERRMQKLSFAFRRQNNSARIPHEMRGLQPVLLLLRGPKDPSPHRCTWRSGLEEKNSPHALQKTPVEPRVRARNHLQRQKVLGYLRAPS